MTGRPRWMSEPARDFVLFGLPVVLVLAWLAWPLITGGETLILRDVLKVHLMLKAPQVEALGGGAFPLIDPLRMGGQPLAGNPNAVPFYPGNLLFLVAPLFWAFNAHFWLHLLLAPIAAYWMSRAWGLSRPASWVAGGCYGASGYMLSQLNLYNLVAGAALVPALVAAVLSAVRTRGGLRWAAASAAGLVWALLLVSGDPLMAVLGLVLAGSAVVVGRGRRSEGKAVVVVLGALALGTLAALPQIVELLRILPSSYRGFRGYSDWRITVGAWRPAHAVEWLVPLAFGRIDRIGAGGLWGSQLFEGKLPLFLSLYPGLLSLGLVAAAGRPRNRAAWWAWGCVGVGVFFAMGGYNPLGAWVFDLPGAGAFRYPVKLWPLVACGATLLCGLGFERSLGAAGGRLESSGRWRLGLPLAVLAVMLSAIWAFLVFAPARFEASVLALAPAGWTPFLAAAERARWIAMVVVSLALCLALIGALVLSRTRPRVGVCLLLVVHVAGQAFLLRPLVATDDAAFYQEPPPALRAVPSGAVVAQGEHIDLFGVREVAVGPDNRPQWLIRQDHLALSPFAGVLFGVRYDLNRSPEGLGSFLGRMAAGVIEAAPSDAVRLRALARWGIDTVIVEAPLRGEAQALGELVGRFAGPVRPIYVYRLPEAAPEVSFAERVLPAPHLNAARDLFLAPDFDPARFVILPGEEPELASPETGERPQGSVRVVEQGAEHLLAEVETASAGVLVVQRAHLPIWKATVDGEPADIEPANLYRMGVRVPAGEHRVRLWVDRRPLVASSIAALIGLLGLAVLAVSGWRRRGEEPGPGGEVGGGTEAAPADSIRTP